MLVQLALLLSLGLPGGSAPLRAPGGTGAPRGRCSGTLLESSLQEVIRLVKDLDLEAVPGLAMVSTEFGRCMSSHLRTFSSSLAALDPAIAERLTFFSSCTSAVPLQDLDGDCPAVHVPGQRFKERLMIFLMLLYEEVQPTTPSPGRP